MSVMHRIDAMANEGYSSYREALAEAYAEEIENVGEGVWSLRVRYRAGRMAWRKRKARKLAEKAAEKEAAAQTEQDAAGEGDEGDEGKKVEAKQA
jgi:CPA2 family monovalent cation:H+ antiporter-2